MVALESLGAHALRGRSRSSVGLALVAVWAMNSHSVLSATSPTSPPDFVADLIRDASSEPGSLPRGFTALGSRILFSAVADLGPRFWSYDPAARDLEPLGDACPVYSPNSGNLVFMAHDEPLAWFAAECGNNVTRLLRTDGTPLGSTVVDLGPRLLDPPSLSNAIAAGASGRAFLALLRDTDLAVWSVDEAGSLRRVVSLGYASEAIHFGLWPVGSGFVLLSRRGPVDPRLEVWSLSRGPDSEWRASKILLLDSTLVVGAELVGGRLLFGVEASDTGPATLWATDGTGPGTLGLGLFPGGLAFAPRGEQEPKDRALFISEGGDSSQLWISDGTAAGTRQIVDFPEGSSTVGFQESWTAIVGDRAFFVADDGLGHRYLESSGLAESSAPKVIRELCPEIPGYWNGHVFNAVGEHLLFDDCDGPSYQVWSLNPVDGELRRLTDFSGSSGPVSFPFVATSGGHLVVGVTDEVFGGLVDLWAIDGEEGSAVRLGSGYYGISGAGARPAWKPDLPQVAGRAMLSISDGKRGFEPYSTDFTRASAGIVADLRFDAPGGAFTSFRDRGSDVLVVARGNMDRSAWIDGVTADAHILVETPIINCATIGYDPNDPPTFHTLSGGVVVQRDVCAPSADLWGAAGSGAETVRLFDESEHPDLQFTGEELEAEGRLYFAFANGEVWQTNGTAAGTGRLATVANDAVPLASLHGSLLVADYPFDGATGSLKSIDESTGATRMILEQTVDSYWAAQAGDRAYFLVDRAFPAGSELWVTDGSVAATTALAQLPTGGWNISGWWDVAGGHLLVIYVHQDLELWFTDGTSAGTFFVDSLVYDGFTNSRVGQANGQTFAASGPRLLRFDPSSREMSPILDLSSESASIGLPDATLVTNERAFFLVGTEAEGHQVWQTAGTVESTSRLSQLPVDAGSVQLLAVLGGRSLLVASYQSSLQAKLWSVDVVSGATTEVVLPSFPLPYPTGEASAFAAGVDRVFLLAADDAHGAELWESDGTEEGTRLVADLNPGPASSSPEDFFVIGDRVFFSADDGVHGRELWTLRLGDTVPCRASERTLCLDHDRFKVDLHYMDFQGNQGDGAATALSADTGYFTFFDPANVESVVKVLDGTGTNGHHWVFEGALTNLQTFLTVTDTATGEAKRYLNGLGNFASFGDPAAFLDAGEVAPAAASVSARVAESGRRDERPAIGGAEALPGELGGASGHCAPASNRLCLQGNRFAVEASWSDFFGGSGVATAVPLTADTGYFWFFADSNVETMVKVLDGRGTNGRFWVFFGALSNVETTLTVTDTETGEVRTYFNPLGRFASVGDVEAF